MHQVGGKRNQEEGMHHPGPGGNLLVGNLPVGNLELAPVGSPELAGEVDSHRKAARMLVVVHIQQEEG
jgi:hypothetical protein